MTNNERYDDTEDSRNDQHAGGSESAPEQPEASAASDDKNASSGKDSPDQKNGRSDDDAEDNSEQDEKSGYEETGENGNEESKEEGTEDKPDDRPTAEDLTPDEVEIDRPDEYVFEYIDSERLPPDVQYTPEFDDDWIYPTGAKSGGSRDDVPVQGLELGIVTEADRLESTVEAILSALETYHRDTGRYPRHRFVSDADSFGRLSNDGLGFVATFQPRPDRHDGLVEHMRAMQTEQGHELVNPNVETAELLTAHLARALTESDVPADGITLDAPEDWRQIADTIILERYAPLASEELYDPTEGKVDLDDPSAETVAELSFTPTYLDVEETDSLLELLETMSEAGTSLADEASEAEERPRDAHQPTQEGDDVTEAAGDRGGTSAVDADDDTASKIHDPDSQDAAEVREDTGEDTNDATVDQMASDVFAEENKRMEGTDQAAENGGNKDGDIGEENSVTASDETEED